MSEPGQMATQVRLDRWLLCAAAVEQAIRGPWSAALAGQSLTALRLGRGLVEPVDPAELGQRAQRLLAQGWGCVRVVVERSDSEQQRAIDSLRGVDGDLRLHVWREAPLQVMETLAAPEATVLQLWRTLRRLPRELRFAGPLAEDPAWRSDYLAALALWERDARAAHGAAFEDLYGVWSATDGPGWRLAERLLVSVGESLAAFATLPAGLTPLAAAAGSRRSHAAANPAPPLTRGAAAAPVRGFELALHGAAGVAQIEVRSAAAAGAASVVLVCRLLGNEHEDFEMHLSRHLARGERRVASQLGGSLATFADLAAATRYTLEIVDRHSRLSHRVDLDLEAVR